MRTGNGADKSTEALVEETISGDREAFARLVDRYRDAASAVAYSYLGGFDDVQDAVQEAFVHAYCNLRQLREPGKFGPWLRRITANCCAMALRMRERSNVSLDETAEQPAVSDDAGRVAARVVVREALGKLSDATRLTVTLAYIDGYSHQDIADFLEVPITAVRSRLRHAKRKLREEMIEMVEDVLHEDKPGEELARKIVEYASRTGRLMIAGADDEALRLCDEALAAIHNLSESATPEEFRELLVHTVESEDDFQDKEQALRNLKTWTVQEIKVREETEMLLRKGEVLLRKRDVDGAKTLFDKAIKLVKSINNREASVKVIATIAHGYARNYHNKLAREYLTQAAENARADENTHAEAHHIWTIATTYLNDIRPALARPFLERARSLFNEAGKPGYAVMVQAVLHLIDDLGEEQWEALEQWLAFCLALRKTADYIEVTDRGGGWGSPRPDERVWKPEVGVLFRIDGFGRFFDTSLPAGASWRGGGKWFVDAFLEITTTIIGYEESVETAQGRFSGCMMLETVVRDTLKGDETEETKQRTLRMCGKRYSWFAPGIGLVHFVTEGDDGSVSIVDLIDYEMVEPSNDYLPLAIGNSWTYGWVDTPEGYVAKERYRVAANEEEHWYLENYRYVLKPAARAGL